MSLQDKFTTFIKYVIIQLVTNNNTDIRDYDRDVKSVKSTLKNELKKHNNNFELAIESTAKILAENEYIISQLKIRYPDKYTEDVTNDADDDKDDSCEPKHCQSCGGKFGHKKIIGTNKKFYCCDECMDDDEDCGVEDEECGGEDEECGGEDEDDDCEYDHEREEFFHFIISCSGLYQVHNLHPDETSKMCNKLFTLLSQ
jgi:hypothetical protein